MPAPWRKPTHGYHCSLFPKARSATVVKQPLIWPPLKIGQRGAAGEAPENTFASFELALREGAEGIILDVQLSSDGVPVVICDARLSRTTSARGRVRQKEANTLIQLDAGSWFNHRFPSRARRQYVQESVPLLFEVLHWVRDQKCMALVAINHSSPEAEAKVLKEIDRAKVRHLTRVIASNLPRLRRLRRLDPKVNLGLHIAGRPPAIREGEGAWRRSASAPLEDGFAVLHSPRAPGLDAGHSLDGGYPAPDAPHDPEGRGRNHYELSGEADRNRGTPSGSCERNGIASESRHTNQGRRPSVPPFPQQTNRQSRMNILGLTVVVRGGGHRNRRCYD